MAVTKGKKKWFPVVGIGDFKDSTLAQAYANTSQDLVGRHLKINLMALIGDPKKQSITLDFVITKAESNQAVAELHSYSINSAHIKRLIRKAVKRIDDSFVAASKDKITCRIKPLLIARFKTNQGVTTALRKKAKEYLKSAIEANTFEDIFSSIITNKLQMGLKKELKQIYPLGISEIRIFEKA